MFMVFEGGEGTGKTTQSKLLVETLRESGLDVLWTREPGGSPGAEAIRGLLVRGTADRWDGLTEIMLFSAARRDHLLRTVLPALARGTVVICDRFVGSSLAYQGAAGVPRDLILEAHRLATQDLARELAGIGEAGMEYDTGLPGLWPDLTLVFEMPPEAGVARSLDREAGKADSETRFESKGNAFHHRVVEGFSWLATLPRHQAINAAGSIDEVAERVRRVVQPCLEPSGATPAP